ncbi:hypothetical protein IMY05_C4622000700 [Salix suchowensis]|nr:hypothetical protein IMY05_C4622000700 [Salix suchowensis]
MYGSSGYIDMPTHPIDPQCGRCSAERWHVYPPSSMWHPTVTTLIARRTKTSNHICGILLRLNEQDSGCPHRETPVQYLYAYHDPDMSDEPAQFIDSVFRMAGLEEPRLEPGEDFLTYVSRRRSRDTRKAMQLCPTLYHLAQADLHTVDQRRQYLQVYGPYLCTLCTLSMEQESGPSSCHHAVWTANEAETRPVYASNNVAKVLLLLHNPEQANKPMRRREALRPRFRTYELISNGHDKQRWAI